MTHFGLHVMCLAQNTRDPYYIMFKPPNIVKIYLISYLVFMKKERMVTAWSNDFNVEQGLMIMTIAMLMTMTIATVIMMVMMTLYYQEEEHPQDSEELKDEDIPSPSGPEDEW